LSRAPFCTARPIFDISLYVNRTPLLNCPNIPPSLRRRVLQGCSSRACPEPVEGFFAPSVAFNRFARMPPSLPGGGMASRGLGAAAPNTIILLGMPRSLLRGGLLRMKSSALPCSPLGANISTLLCEALPRHSLHVTGCGLALLSQGNTTLQHSQSPGCTGCLLRGLLAVPPGLSLSKSRLDFHRLADDSFRTHQRQVRQSQPCSINTRW